MKKLIAVPALLLFLNVSAQSIPTITPVATKHIVAMANRADSVISYLRHSGMPDAQLTYITLLLKEAVTPLINDVWVEKRKIDSTQYSTRKPENWDKPKKPLPK